jgi:tRNA nucleotidyltransferase (CCA-adding enzyme)
LGCPVAILVKRQPNALKKTRMDFGHEFLGGKMVKKIFERLHMPLNQNEICSKIVMMSSRPIVLSQETVTDSAVRRLVFDAEDVKT